MAEFGPSTDVNRRMPDATIIKDTADKARVIQLLWLKRLMWIVLYQCL